MIPATDREWWKENGDRFKDGTRYYNWGEEMRKAIGKHGLPPGVTGYYYRNRMKYAGLPADESVLKRPWTKKDDSELRAISRLPIFKRHGWRACSERVLKLGIFDKKKKKNTTNKDKQDEDN